MPSSDVTTLKGIFLSKIIFFLILFSDGREVEVVVHIVQENRKKPFLGGYKHRLTGVEFHNAAAQTIPKIRVPSSVEKFHRDTQTYKLRNRVQQTTNTTSTQMVCHEFDKIGC